MLKPIDNLRYVIKNLKIIKRDYNLLNISVCFFLIPIGLALFLTSFLDISKIISMFKDTITFFSITIGFLINALVFILLNKSGDEKMTKKENLDKIEILKESLSYNILNLIIFSSIFLILILFYNFYPNLSIHIKSFKFNTVEFVIMVLFLEIVILFFNILRKFGAYIETKYEN